MTNQTTAGPSRAQWANAFARQSRSDFAVYHKLSSDQKVPACHSLHYLQMSCEKIAKAYRLRDTAANVDDLLSRHVGFEKFIGPFLHSPHISTDFASNPRQLTRTIHDVRRETQQGRMDSG